MENPSLKIELEGKGLVQMSFDYNTVVDKTAETLVEASTTFRTDQVAAYERAIEREKNSHSRWVLETILENANTAQKKRLPLCDDTGVPHLFLEIGEDASVPPHFFTALREGVAEGLRRLPARPMAVLGNDYERITQEAGLSEDPGDLLPAPIQMETVPGDKIRVSVLMLGGGPEIRGKTQRVFHKHSLDVVIDEMVSWAKAGAAKLGCLPCVLGFGIGRTNTEAASLALKAMKDGDFSKQNEMEKRITAAVNAAEIGPLGLGGINTALATFVKVGPQRASGIRVISLRVGCCFDPRRANVIFKF